MTVEAPSLPAAKPTAAPPSAPKAVAPAREWWIEVASDRAALEKHVPAWERLARDAAEPNVFYEPWMFLPGLDHFGSDQSVQCVFVYRQGPQLCGFFPLQRTRRFKGLPVASLRLWEHLYGFLCTPLVHRDWMRETLHALFDWTTAEARCSLLQLPKIHGDGPFQHALIDVLRARNMLSFVDEAHTRALIQRGVDAESYLSATSSSSRKQWRRLRKRLSEEGRLESRALTAADDASVWIEQFLELEASGWKGKEGSALAADISHRAYFRGLASSAFARGQLHMLGLFLDGRPIAMQCNFLAGQGGFAFKIAFDERYAKFSPGVQLELDNIADLHRRSNTQWLDSCVDPGPHMIDRLWHERRIIQSLVIATSRWTGNGVVGLLPLVRALKRILRK